jgi:signal transduction histidine kinase
VATYTLPLQEAPPFEASPRRKDKHLARPLLTELRKNVRWFCRLRWIVASVLLAFGLLALIPGLGRALHLSLEPSWLLTVGGLVVLSNLIFLRLSGATKKRPKVREVLVNLWAQIVFDLIMLTVVVHFIGSLGTFAPFSYLFHTVMACLVFTWTESFLVTSLASGMYVGCVVLEVTGVLAPATVFASYGLSRSDLAFWDMGLQIFTTVGIWFVVWYMAAKLSSMVRARREELVEANRMLVAANAERVRHMLHTTHELKAPFAAIYANIQLLERGSFGALPERAAQVLGRLGVRCRDLSQEIKEMLQLANLESTVQDLPPLSDMDLKDMIIAFLKRIRPSVEVKNITIEEELESAHVKAFPDHIEMLFDNLLANAVAYSRKGGTVRVQCRPEPNGDAVVVVEDEGIGIEPSKLPKIFEAYYRTEKAVMHNQASTGLGLTIVRNVARANGIGITVESALNQGTKFTVRVPPFPIENEPAKIL